MVNRWKGGAIARIVGVAPVKVLLELWWIDGGCMGVRFDSPGSVRGASTLA